MYAVMCSYGIISYYHTGKGNSRDDNKNTLYRYREVKTGKFGCVNRKGKVIVKPTYDFIDTFVDGLAQVEKNGKYGYINSKGKEVIKVQYKQADRFSEGLALIQEGKKYKYIDKTGSTVINVKENIRPSFRKDMQACR